MWRRQPISREVVGRPSPQPVIVPVAKPVVVVTLREKRFEALKLVNAVYKLKELNEECNSISNYERTVRTELESFGQL